MASSLLANGGCCKRIFPVGRLDKDTDGLLLLTNDGDFANKLTHPSFEVKKEYFVVLDKPLSDAAKKAVAKGYCN